MHHYTKNLVVFSKSVTLNEALATEIRLLTMRFKSSPNGTCN